MFTGYLHEVAPLKKKTATFEVTVLGGRWDASRYLTMSTRKGDGTGAIGFGGQALYLAHGPHYSIKISTGQIWESGTALIVVQ